MGVWIETYNTRLLPEPWHVTPCMGVWIETSMEGGCRHHHWSHPVWVCGLKLLQRTATSYPPRVTPCMGVWIETVLILTGHNNIKCHTLYGCVD